MQRQTGGGGTEVYNSRFQAPVRGGNRFTLLTDGRFFFDRLLAAIDGSKEYVLAEFYLVESGQVADRFIAAFARATARGVRVRILFDAIGARALREVDRVRLRAAGAELVLFNVPRWRALTCVLVRDHRKLLLVDGTTGFTGGVGIADMFSPTAQPEHYWLDCIVEITGPVLEDWHALFARTWVRSTRRKLDVSPSPSRSVPQPPPMQSGERGRVAAGAGLGTKELGRSVIKQVRKANSRVWIATAYFWPSSRLRRALRRAARCGIDVRLLLPRTPDRCAGGPQRRPSVLLTVAGQWRRHLRISTPFFACQDRTVRRLGFGRIQQSGSVGFALESGGESGNRFARFCRTGRSHVGPHFRQQRCAAQCRRRTASLERTVLALDYPCHPGVEHPHRSAPASPMTKAPSMKAKRPQPCDGVGKFRQKMANTGPHFVGSNNAI